MLAHAQLREKRTPLRRTPLKHCLSTHDQHVVPRRYMSTRRRAVMQACMTDSFWRGCPGHVARTACSTGLSGDSGSAARTCYHEHGRSERGLSHASACHEEATARNAQLLKRLATLEAASSRPRSRSAMRTTDSCARRGKTRRKLQTASCRRSAARVQKTRPARSSCWKRSAARAYYPRGTPAPSP